MHELGIIIEVGQTVERIAREQNLTQIQRLTLQIGELSSVIPYFVEQCYPAAVDGTMLEQTELEIEVLPGNGLCKSCGKVFNLREHERTCPRCGARSWELLGGKEFNIKEILAC